MLRVIQAEDLRTARSISLDTKTIDEARAIVDSVRDAGDAALRESGERFGDIASNAPLVIDRSTLKEELASISLESREVLERVALRIEKFALAQRASISETEIAVPGGRAGHTVRPVHAAGCYAPGGRFPLPSSVLMTAVTARAAGVKTVVVASPKPTKETLAACAVADVDMLLCVGGAAAVSALAYGTDTIPRCDVIVGPGNRWVTAAKHLVSSVVGIDMLAGPSELLIIADDSASPKLVAADLIAQAEHDTDAIPILISLSSKLVEAVNDELERQLQDLPTAEIARLSLRENGFALVVADEAEAIQISDEVAPEHLEVVMKNADAVAEKLTNYGGLFIGSHSAEVFGDYGAGPNHVLPTGGTARFGGGLSVLDFLKVQTWLRSDERDDSLIEDTVALARMEGLEGHARAALVRKSQGD